MRAALIVLFCLSGCGEETAAPVAREKAIAAPQRPVPSGPALPPPELLSGTWDVIGYDPPVRGADGWVIRVTIGRSRIDAISQCVPFHWLYGVSEGRLVLSPQGHDAPVCARPLTFPEQAFSALMQSAERIALEGDRLVVSGPHGRIFMERVP